VSRVLSDFHRKNPRLRDRSIPLDELIDLWPIRDAAPDAPRVYFIQGVQGGPIKIGYTRSPGSSRLSMLQTGNPHELRVTREIAGDRDLERFLHNRFAHCRVIGEWFASTDRDLVRLARANVSRFDIFDEAILSEIAFEVQTRVNEIVNDRVRNAVQESRRITLESLIAYLDDHLGTGVGNHEVSVMDVLRHRMRSGGYA
jgi:hypothetical protein